MIGYGLRLHRGDTLSWPCAATNPDGTAVNLTGATVEAKVVGVDGTLIGTLTTAIVSAAGGTFTVSATAAATSAWAVGGATFLIQYTIGAVVTTVESPMRIDRGW